MKVLSEETGFVDVKCWRIPTEQAYVLTKQSVVICLRKIPIYYVSKNLLYNNFFSPITAVTLFMQFLCVSSDVNKETWFVSRKNNQQCFRLYMCPGSVYTFVSMGVVYKWHQMPKYQQIPAKCCAVVKRQWHPLYGNRSSNHVVWSQCTANTSNWFPWKLAQLIEALH
jgi:hypothetical protein